MKIVLVKYFSLCLLLGGATNHAAYGFASPGRQETGRRSSSVLSRHMSTTNGKFNADEYAKSMSAAAIEQMKNLKPEDIDRMIQEMDNMGPLQRSALKAMNMDVSL
jgi:hypothetical protein